VKLYGVDGHPLPCASGENPDDLGHSGGLLLKPKCASRDLPFNHLTDVYMEAPRRYDQNKRTIVSIPQRLNSTFGLRIVFQSRAFPKGWPWTPYSFNRARRALPLYALWAGLPETALPLFREWLVHRVDGLQPSSIPLDTRRCTPKPPMVGRLF
jgi:hypothetical protein